MTKITIFRNQDQAFLGFDCLGHAGYAEEGEDIVCAGISALVINTINSLGVYTKEKFSTDSDEETGMITLKFDSPAGHDADLLMKVLTNPEMAALLTAVAKTMKVYSVNNSLLIMMQKPDAQLCQSFTGWKQMGRYVKKGEKGISILAPAPYKIEREQTKLDDKGRPVFDADGER